MPRDDDYEDDDYDDRPRRSRGGDEIAHRGGLVLAFGIISVVIGIAGCGPVGLVLGILAWRWGAKDQQAMDAGAMDPEGRGLTQAGMITGIIGTVINGLMTLLLLAYLVFFVVVVAAAGVGAAAK